MGASGASWRSTGARLARVDAAALRCAAQSLLPTALRMRTETAFSAPTARGGPRPRRRFRVALFIFSARPFSGMPGLSCCLTHTHTRGAVGSLCGAFCFGGWLDRRVLRPPGCLPEPRQAGRQAAWDRYIQMADRVLTAEEDPAVARTCPARPAGRQGPRQAQQHRGTKPARPGAGPGRRLSTWLGTTPLPYSAPWRRPEHNGALSHTMRQCVCVCVRASTRCGSSPRVGSSILPWRNRDINLTAARAPEEPPEAPRGPPGPR